MINKFERWENGEEKIRRSPPQSSYYRHKYVLALPALSAEGNKGSRIETQRGQYFK